jgi:hypothetical protein
VGVGSGTQAILPGDDSDEALEGEIESERSPKNKETLDGCAGVVTTSEVDEFNPDQLPSSASEKKQKPLILSQNEASP